MACSRATLWSRPNVRDCDLPTFLIDTNVAIHLRDGHQAIAARIGRLDGPILLSVLSVVELEGGVDRNPAVAAYRRDMLDEMTVSFGTVAFDHKEARIYGRIVAACGYSRARVFDRMIAAQAISLDATLITINGADFRDIPGLKLEIWTNPDRD